LKPIIIEKLVYGAEALVRLEDGRVVFLPVGFAPQDTITLDETWIKKKKGRLLVENREAIKLLAPSPLRITPVCTHFLDCGGCHLQHINPNGQLAYKTEVVKESFSRIAKLPHVTIHDCLRPPEPLGYRNKVVWQTRQYPERYELTFVGSQDPILTCHLISAEANALKDWLQKNLPVTWQVEQVTLKLGDVHWALILNTAKPAERLSQFYDRVREAFPQTQILINEAPSHRQHFGPMHLGHTISSDLKLESSPESFFQVNLGVTAQVIQWIQSKLLTLKLYEQAVLFDLYCGGGLLSFALEKEFSMIYAAELSDIAIEDAKHNVRSESPQKMQWFNQTAEDFLLDAKAQELVMDVIILDPPRKGLSQSVKESLSTLPLRHLTDLEPSPQILFYMSCDPVTLARDAADIEALGSWTLLEVQPFDMFAQTYHVECVAVFKRV
jgi:23S rRNA (uracil1939-C5)-methyltransferase